MRLIASAALLLMTASLPASAQDDVIQAAEPAIGKSETIGAGGRPVGKPWSRSLSLLRTAWRRPSIHWRPRSRSMYSKLVEARWMRRSQPMRRPG